MRELTKKKTFKKKKKNKKKKKERKKERNQNHLNLIKLTDTPQVIDYVMHTSTKRIL